MSKKYWVTESLYRTKGKDKKVLYFWEADISTIDFNSNWRFCPANNRISSKYLGTISDISFPVIFPIALDNGHIIKEEDHNHDHKNE